MTYFYSGDPSTSIKDSVRFYIQDTDPVNGLLSDEEIYFLINSWAAQTNSVLILAAIACEVIAASVTSDVSYSADGVSLSAGDLQNKYNELAKSLRDLDKQFRVGGGPDAGGMMIGEGYAPGVKPLQFGTGMHDNIRAGEQEFAGLWPDWPFWQINDGYPTGYPVESPPVP